MSALPASSSSGSQLDRRTGSDRRRVDDRRDGLERRRGGDRRGVIRLAPLRRVPTDSFTTPWQLPDPPG